MSDVLKGLDNYKAFEKYSKKSSKYNKEGNDKAWRSLRGHFNINYLIDIVNKTTKFKKYKMKYIQPTIAYKDIDTKEADLDKDKYLDIKKYIKKNATTCLLIKSDTGTGKTTSTADYLKTLKGVQVISIVSRITLGEQQVETFGKANIVLHDYRNTFDSEDNI